MCSSISLVWCNICQKPFIFGILFIVAFIVCLDSAFGPCFVIQYLISFLFLNNIWLRKRQLVALVLLYSCFHMAVSFLCAMIGL